jgi:putative ABC transport system ATP-binding protein
MPPGGLRAQGLKGVRGEFSNLNLELPAGARLAVVGPSGAGKTTLLRALALLDPLESGEVWLEKEKGSFLPPQGLKGGAPAWRAEVSLVPQDPPVIAGSPQDLFHRVLSYRQQRQRSRQGVNIGDPQAIAESWGLPALAWEKEWSLLSGGERQRAALAIALALNPSCLLLDEPTSALDDASTSKVESSILRSGITCVWVTHNRGQSARVATHLLEIDSGKVSLSTAPGNLA